MNFVIGFLTIFSLTSIISTFALCFKIGQESKPVTPWNVVVNIILTVLLSISVYIMWMNR